jgi:hypothetical protein
VISERDELARFESLVRSHEISPELVLVDADLATVARASLSTQPNASAGRALASREIPTDAPMYYAFDAPPVVHLNTARRPDPPLSPREKVVTAVSYVFSLVMPAVLLFSVLVNLALAGAILGMRDDPTVTSSQQTTWPGRTVLNADTKPAPRLGNRHAATRRTPRRHANVKAGAASVRSRARAKASAERTVLRLLQTAPRTRVAPLIDPNTGLVRNNVQAVCHSISIEHLRPFACVIQSASRGRIPVIHIRYSLDAHGQAHIKWLQRPNLRSPISAQ